MAQLEDFLPVAHMTSAEGGPTFSTTVYPGSTGLESRNTNWAEARQAWSLTYMGTIEDLQPLFDLFILAKGLWQSFQFIPPGEETARDFRFDSDMLRVGYQPGHPDLILTVSVNILEVIGE